MLWEQQILHSNVAHVKATVSGDKWDQSESSALTWEQQPVFLPSCSDIQDVHCMLPHMIYSKDKPGFQVFIWHFPLLKNTVYRPAKTDTYVQSAQELSVFGPALYYSYL